MTRYLEFRIRVPAWGGDSLLQPQRNDRDSRLEQNLQFW